MNVWMNECVNEWMCEGMNVWMNECVNGWMCEGMNVWMNECVKEWMCEWMNVWMDECVKEWMCEWMNVWMNECVNEWMNRIENNFRTHSLNNEMTLHSRQRIRNSSPGGLRSSTLLLGHGGSQQYLTCEHRLFKQAALTTAPGSRQSLNQHGFNP